ncbi:MAG: hypothetical protein AB7Q17_07245 [Phycisphaerae bacterium]
MASSGPPAQPRGWREFGPAFGVARRLRSASMLAGCAALLALRSALATDYAETEPNNSKGQANTIGGLAAGDTITGLTTSNTGAGLDYFRITPAPLAPGVYRHRLALASATPGHGATLRGRSQDAGVILNDDQAALTASSVTTPPRMVQWYGFGRSEPVVYRVTGAAATTQPYVATLETAALAAPNLGAFEPGPLTITTRFQNHNTDTDLWVYDEQGNPLAGFGNDDAAGGVLQSTLTREFADGVYHLAIGRFNLANHLASPADDAFRAGVVLDFAGAALSSGAGPDNDVSFAITDSTGVRQFAALLTEPFELAWFRFTVGVPAGACDGYLRGDANGDGRVNNFDIDAFVLALADEVQYLAVHCADNPECRRCRADMDGDGDVRNFDIDPFVACLAAAPAEGEPCP